MHCNVDVLLERKTTCPFQSFTSEVYVLVLVFVFVFVFECVLLLAFVFVLYLYVYLYWAGSRWVGGVWPVGHWLPPNVSILSSLLFHYHYQIQTELQTKCQFQKTSHRQPERMSEI